MPARILAVMFAASLLALSGCETEEQTWNDFDGDGYEDDGDCAPEDPGIHPGAEDAFGDGIDQDCDDCGTATLGPLGAPAGDGIDRDCDGYPGNSILLPDHEQYWDCDDNNPYINPGAEEDPTNDVDENCDGTACPDEGRDDDGDGFCEGIDLDGDDVDECCAGEGDPGDCDDNESDSYPGNVESCDAVDENCDGIVDDGFDDDGDGVTECGPDGDGGNTDDDCDDNEAAVYPGAKEICDGILDNDCDGNVDPAETDDDNDGSSECDGDCDDFDPILNGDDQDADGASSCDGDCDDLDPLINLLDLDGDGADTCHGDCDDYDSERYPGAKEQPCDGIDNDCDNQLHAQEADADQDGFSLCDGDCDDGDAQQNLDDLDNDGYTSCDGDCDDASASAWPGNTEVACDYLDNDCSGSLHPDEVDDDLDGFDECQGDCDDTNGGLTPEDSDEDGWSTCDGDCNDFEASLNLDDADGDGQNTCDGDCDDADPLIWYGAFELPCDGLDNDCDSTLHPWEQDVDQDGWSICDGDCDDGDNTLHLADGDMDGYTSCGLFGQDQDCNDNDPAINPGATESAGDSIDNNCDGVVDGGIIPCDLSVPGDYATITAAIQGASDHDVICVQGGLYTENLVLDRGISLTLLSMDGPAATTINGNTSRVIHVEEGLGTTTVIQGFTIIGGLATDGAGVYVTDSSLSLRHSVVTGNMASNLGGGIYANQAELWVESCKVTYNDAYEGGGINFTGSTGGVTGTALANNEASIVGGGISMVASNVALTADEIVDNVLTSTGMGGGIFMDGTSVTNMNRCTVSGNSAWNGAGMFLGDGAEIHAHHLNSSDNAAQNDGGAIHWGSPIGSMDNALFLDNTAGQFGGALFIGTSGSNLSNLRVVGNAAGIGGGIYFDDPALQLLENTLLAGNDATFGGGAGTFDGAAQLNNCALVGNSASEGGGFWATDAAVVMNNTDISGNSSPDGGAFKQHNATYALYYCNSWDNGPDPFGGAADPTGMSDNIAADPEYLNLLPADPRWWDLHLDSGSTLVDAGDPGNLDPDGGTGDIGIYGGPAAGDWDLDDDGSEEWWQPGPYDEFVYPAEGWDCDDLDPSVTHLDGC